MQSRILPIIPVLFLTLKLEQVSSRIKLRGIVSWSSFCAKLEIKLCHFYHCLGLGSDNCYFYFGNWKKDATIYDIHNIGHWMCLYINLAPTYDGICRHYVVVVKTPFYYVYHHYVHPLLDHVHHYCCNGDHLLGIEWNKEPCVHIHQL